MESPILLVQYKSAAKTLPVQDFQTSFAGIHVHFTLTARQEKGKTFLRLVATECMNPGENTFRAKQVVFKALRSILGAGYAQDGYVCYMR